MLIYPHTNTHTRLPISVGTYRDCKWSIGRTHSLMVLWNFMRIQIWMNLKTFRWKVRWHASQCRIYRRRHSIKHYGLARASSIERSNKRPTNWRTWNGRSRLTSWKLLNETDKDWFTWIWWANPKPIDLHKSSGIEWVGMCPFVCVRVQVAYKLHSQRSIVGGGDGVVYYARRLFAVDLFHCAFTALLLFSVRFFRQAVFIVLDHSRSHYLSLLPIIIFNWFHIEYSAIVTNRFLAFIQSKCDRSQTTFTAASVCRQIPRIFLLPSKFCTLATEFDRWFFFYLSIFKCHLTCDFSPFFSRIHRFAITGRVFFSSTVHVFSALVV